MLVEGDLEQSLGRGVGVTSKKLDVQSFSFLAPVLWQKICTAHSYSSDGKYTPNTSVVPRMALLGGGETVRREGLQGALQWLLLSSGSENEVPMS